MAEQNYIYPYFFSHCCFVVATPTFFSQGISQIAKVLQYSVSAESSIEINERPNQWQILNFPDGGMPIAKVRSPTCYFGQFFPQNCVKIKEIGTGRVTLAPPPGSIIANAISLQFCFSNIMPKTFQ